MNKQTAHVKAQKWWQRPTFTDWVLAVTTTAYVVVTVFILLAIKRESRIAKEAADAAKLNAQAVINSERPLILVNIEMRSADSSVRIIGLNKGKTTACITSIDYNICFLESADKLDPNPFYNETELTHPLWRSPGESFYICETTINDLFLGFTQKHHGKEPCFEWQMGIVEDCASGDGKLVLAVRAPQQFLVGADTGQFAGLATWALRAERPAQTL